MKTNSPRQLLPLLALVVMAGVLSLSSAFAATRVTAPVKLGTAGTFAILAKSGISSVPQSTITGDIGVSPISAAAITGFSLKADASNVFSTSAQVNGRTAMSTRPTTRRRPPPTLESRSAT